MKCHDPPNHLGENGTNRVKRKSVKLEDAFLKDSNETFVRLKWHLKVC